MSIRTGLTSAASTLDYHLGGARVWVLCLCSVLFGCARFRESPKSEQATLAPSSITLAQQTAPPVPMVRPPALDAPASFADLTARVDPAVIFVRTTQLRRTGLRVVPGVGVGSAFVYDPDGLILTNHHVIEGAQEIFVRFGRKREVSAAIVGIDPPTDIAVLRVAEKGLPALVLGDSDAIRVGDWALAIGNPFGLAHTVSAGIISAKGRTSQDVEGLPERGYYDFLQTDASINPGNSGGPLLDTLGRVVGINTAIRPRANSIGFAIPINMVKELLPRLLKDGRIRRSAVGVKAGEITPEVRQALGLPDESGAVVAGVIPGGPADRAGVLRNDVIVAFDNQQITGPDRLRWVASLAGVGKEVTLHMLRSGNRMDVRVRLSDLGEQPAVPEEVEEEPWEGTGR